MKVDRHPYRLLWLAVLVPALVLSAPLPAPAEEQVPKDSSAFTYNIRALAFGGIQDPANSTQNPENAFLRLPRYSGEIDLRPDLFYDGDAVSAVLKPRLAASYRWWEDGAASGERDGLARAFVNEWRVQAKLHSSLFLSFGKEKLLWGPSFLASPSNILFRDTEKANPRAEVEGKYLGRVIYLPNNQVTITALSETQKDAQLPEGNDRPMRALKADWVGGSSSVSLIGYVRRGDRLRIGSYGQWTASDAVLLYYDGIVTRGTDALYPLRDPANPLGGTFARRLDGAGRFYPTVIAGGSYTFPGGSTASLEFLYNRPGYGDAEAADYYAIRRNAADHFFDPGPLSGLSQGILARTVSTGLPFLRHYYLMGQYQVLDIGNRLDVTVRYVHGIEERAGQASSIVEWKLTDSVTLFNIDSAATGGPDTEFGSIIGKSALLGVEVHF